jgi:hypothetical protein
MRPIKEEREKDSNGGDGGRSTADGSHLVGGIDVVVFSSLVDRRGL